MLATMSIPLHILFYTKRSRTTIRETIPIYRKGWNPIIDPEFKLRDHKPKAGNVAMLLNEALVEKPSFIHNLFPHGDLSMVANSLAVSCFI